MKKHKEMQKLPCKLTSSDRDRKTSELVRLEQEEAKKKVEKKLATAKVNAELKETRAAIEQNVRELSEGTELREVEVEARYDTTIKRVIYVRLDTNEEVEARDMDAFDLQDNFAFEGDVLPPPANPQPRLNLEPLPETMPDGYEPAEPRATKATKATKASKAAKDGKTKPHVPTKKAAKVISIADRRKAEKKKPKK